MSKTLKQVLGNFPVQALRGEATVAINSLSYDSRCVKEGALFFALKGTRVNGHDYIDSVIAQGAKVIVHTQDLKSYSTQATYVQVEDIKRAMAYLSDRFYDHPSGKLTVLGVTGTDGKSSSVFFSYQILKALGEKVGFISTVAYDVGEGIKANPFHQSTPESLQIQYLLAEMVANGMTYAVLECTSHGLSQKNQRLAYIDFHSALLTNISEEHLDFHGDLQSYVNDKLQLFRWVKRGVVNASCPFIDNFLAQTEQVFSYGLETDSDYTAGGIQTDFEGQKFIITHEGQSYWVYIPLLGDFNVENVCGVLALLHATCGVSLQSAVKCAGQLKQAKGRLDPVELGQDFRVFVDFAHTPGSFSRLLPAMKKQASNRLLVVFGCAGERYTANRSLMGELANRWADIVILTDDEPRGEEPVDITEQIAQGISNRKKGQDFFIINDRKKAIELAVDLCQSGDCLLILGKGHETSLIYKDKKIAWCDHCVAIEAVCKKLEHLRRKKLGS